MNCKKERVYKECRLQIFEIPASSLLYYLDKFRDRFRNPLPLRDFPYKGKKADKTFYMKR